MRSREPEIQLLAFFIFTSWTVQCMPEGTLWQKPGSVLHSALSWIVALEILLLELAIPYTFVELNHQPQQTRHNWLRGWQFSGVWVTQVSHCRFLNRWGLMEGIFWFWLLLFNKCNSSQIFLHLIISGVLIPFHFPFNFYGSNLFVCLGDLLEGTTTCGFPEVI